jgi:hypothetical protein
MAGEVQGFIQVAPPMIDLTYSIANNPQGTIGNAPTTLNPSSPSGGAINASLGQWILTGGAASLITDAGASGDAASGVEFSQVCTPGTINGIGSPFGVVGRFTQPPVGTIVNPMTVNYQMVRFEVFGLHWDAVPTGTQCGRDSGVMWLANGAANGAIFDISQALNGGQNVGWGVLYNVATASLVFAAKQLSGTGVAQTVFVNMGNPANGVTKPFYLDMRWIAPTATTAASLQVFLDKTQVVLTAAQSSWIAGTLLPAANASATATTGYLPCIMNNTPVADTANPVLHFYGARIRAGSVLACTLENMY